MRTVSPIRLSIFPGSKIAILALSSQLSKSSGFLLAPKSLFTCDSLKAPMGTIQVGIPVHVLHEYIFLPLPDIFWVLFGRKA